MRPLPVKLLPSRCKSVKPVKDRSAGGSLTGYFEVVAERLRSEGRPSEAGVRSLKRSVAGFLDGREVGLCDVDAAFIQSYSRYLERRVVGATVSFYLRTLRRVLNMAREDGLTDLVFDWPGEVNISVERDRRASTCAAPDCDVIRKIAEVDLTDAPRVEFVRDMFMFCFYADGMELVDVANLLKSDLTDGVITYRRRGGGRVQSVAPGPKAAGIIERRTEAGSDYLFPILQRGGRDYALRSVHNEFAAAMKEIGRRIGYDGRLTFGMSRASWLAMQGSVNVGELLV